MTEEQRNRLQALVHPMQIMAWRKVSNNDMRKACAQVAGLRCLLNGEPQERTAEEWLAIAEKAAEGHDKPGTIRMTMERVLSGMPPEHKGESV